MKLLEQIQALERVDQLIRLKATGTPAELAKRLNISERTVYYLLNTFRDLGIDIRYCKERRSYCYETRITIQFLKVKIDICDNIKGGENKLDFFNATAKFLQCASLPL